MKVLKCCYCSIGPIPVLVDKAVPNFYDTRNFVNC